MHSHINTTVNDQPPTNMLEKENLLNEFFTQQ